MTTQTRGHRFLWILIPLLVLALLAVPLARFLWFYRGLPLARDVRQPDLSRLAVPTPASLGFVDQPAAGRGLVLVDRAHDNLFSPAELSVLTARLTARGLSVRDLGGDEDLAQALRPATALVVITPGREFTPGEVTAIRRFVERGGRLLLVADPTRYAVTYDDVGEPAVADSALLINPLAVPFGLSFEDDYLYNVVRHEGNYQNIVLEKFSPNVVTAGLAHVAFYATHSVHAASGGLILADADTHSSTDELGKDLAVAALDPAGRVLLLGDLTFMTSPYAGVLDNGRLVANVADFLASAERRYGIVDFPYFFGDEVVLVPVGEFRLGAVQVTEQSQLQGLLQAQDRRTIVSDSEDPAHDAFFVGVFSDTTDVAPYLEAAGVSIQAGADLSYTLTIDGAGEVDGSDIALLLLQYEGQRAILVLLADREANLQLASQALAAGDLSGCLSLRETLLLCALGEGGGGGYGNGGGGGQGGEGEEDGGTEGGKLLVVAEDDLFTAANCFVSGEYYASFLSLDYAVDTWSEYDQGNPTLEDLQQYAAVFWTTGTCSHTAPSADDAETLRKYVAAGGRLLIDGLSIGKDWGQSEFYAEVCHAEHSGNSTQLDVEVVTGDHPLTKGWEQGRTITFSEGVADYAPDVVAVLAGATVVGARGPASDDAGAPAIIAYESGDTRVAYVAFPLFFLPEEDIDTFLKNAAAWLLGK